MRDEKFSTRDEIIRELELYDGNQKNAGPIMYTDGGKYYMDTSPGHIKIVGGTGYGKTYTLLNFKNTIETSEENLLGVFPKPKDILEMNNNDTGRRRIILDLRNPAGSPDRINLLEYPYRLLHSEDVSERDIGRVMVRNIYECVYPTNPHADPFWDIAARRLLSGITYGLSEKNVGVDKFNLKSVSDVLMQAEERAGARTKLQVFYESLDPDSLGRSELSSYMNAARETKCSIHSVASCGFSETFTISEGLLSMLCSEPTIHLHDFDLETTPFSVYIIIPDESKLYAKVAAIIIQTFYQMLITRAENEYGGSLRQRTNIFLEELGNLGASLPTLGNMITAARSRNVRITACLQSDKQLTDLYSPSQAKTIDSCLSVAICFSNSDYDMLESWSKAVGEKIRTVIDNNNIYTRPERIITANQIRAMPVGTALIFLRNTLKFISAIPDYHDIFDIKEVEYKRRIVKSVPKIPVYSIQKEVEKIRKKELEEMLGSFSGSEKTVDIPKMMNPKADPTELVQEIDARIEELEEEAKREAKKMARRKKSGSRKNNSRSRKKTETENEPDIDFYAVPEEEIEKWFAEDETEE